jgi:signal transduction histidine kinase
MSLLIATLCVSFSSCNKINKDKELALKQADFNHLGELVSPYLQNRDYHATGRALDSIYRSTPSPSIYTTFQYYNTHSWMNNDLGNYQPALNYADSAIDLIERTKTEELFLTEYPQIYMQKGNAYVGLLNYPKAYECFFKIKILTENTKADFLKIDIERNIAMVLYKQQQFGLAKNSFIDEVGYMKKCAATNPYMETDALQQEYDNVALCYTKLKQYDSAKYYYQMALDNIEKYKYIAGRDSLGSLRRYASCKGVIYGNLAKIFIATNNLDSAESLYKQAIYLNTKIGFEHADAQLCQAQLAELQMKKGDWLPLLQTLNELHKSLDTLSNREAQLGWYQLMAAYYAHNNNAVRELPYYKQFIAIRDSVNAGKKISQETTITKEMRDKERELKISLLEKEKQLNKLTIWIIAAISLLIIMIAMLVYRNYKRGKKNIVTLTHLNQQISEQQQHTESALQQLEISNKDKDRILRVVAHDLRNPIGGIAALSQSMLEKQMEDEQYDKLLKMIENTSTNSLSLINELLQANNYNDAVIEKQDVDINQLLRQASFMLQFKAKEKGQVIETDLPDDAILVSINAEKTERVISNLIGNAIKFSPRDSNIRIQLQKQDDSVLIAVKDKGIGISKEELPQVFDMFTSAKRKGTAGEKSFGLGLSICKQIVEAQGGKIWVESEEGVGSIFYVSLPLGDV